MIRALLLGLAVAGCARPADRQLVECQRNAPPWATAECGGRR